MIKKSTFIHLRLPFSFFLMPVFLFACSIVKCENWFNFWLAFFVLHGLLYPASNAYNSYYDKDEESIGGIENPPPVDKELYYTSLVLDTFAIGLGLLISWQFAVALLIYGLVSKAYSHDKIRLKKRPILGWLTVGVFQGAFTFVMTALALNPAINIGSQDILFPAALSTCLLLGSYPLTQVYQHGEDGRRGDKTISLMLGIKGTFIFTAICFAFSGAGFIYYYFTYQSLELVYLLLLAFAPVVIFFNMWFFKILKDEKFANFKLAMRMNLISAVCLNAFFFMAFISKVWGEELSAIVP